jgi:hypothetical protein
MGEIFNNIIGGIQYDIFRILVGPMIVTIAATAIVKKAFGAIQQRKEAITFAVSVFVICATLFYFVGGTSQRPRPALKATINFIAVTDETATPNIAAITTITVLNSGEMQSVAGGISLRTVIDGKTYIGVRTGSHDFWFGDDARTIG